MGEEVWSRNTAAPVIAKSYAIMSGSNWPSITAI